MALVTLVVIGHAWTLLPQTTLNNHFYDFLYAWHIPAFVFVTGYLSRGFAYTPQRFWQLFRTVVVPYLIFECAFALFRVHVGGENLEDLFADPHWPLWYLSALFFWRLMTPIFRTDVGRGRGRDRAEPAGRALAGRHPRPGPGVRAAAVLRPRAEGHPRAPRAVARAVGQGRRRCGLRRHRGAHPLHRPDRGTEWLYYRSRYDELDVSDPEAVVIRLAVLAIGALGAFAFLALVPRAGGWFARMGAYTLVVYLFHGFVIKGVEYADFPGWAVGRPDLALALTTVGGLLLALFLAWRPLASRLQDVVDPFGYAERHARHAVAITAVVTEDEPDGPRMPSGGVSG